MGWFEWRGLIWAGEVSGHQRKPPSYWRTWRRAGGEPWLLLAGMGSGSMAKGKSHCRPGRTLLKRQLKASEVKRKAAEEARAARAYDRQQYDGSSGEPEG